MNLKEKRNIVPIISFILTVVVVICVYILMGYAPFGGKTIAAMDANIQYLDFFAYLKNVLLGKDSINYSYTSLLGGNNISLVSYYLMSPLNLLVIFFKKSQLGIFVNLIYLLKLSLASATMTYFLGKVTKERLQNSICVILGICYALMQYDLAQGSNIIWLDGVYMLPLILLGVHYLVVGQKSILLPVTVGLSIIFNWYTGGINCLFAGVWFLFELSLNAKKDEILANLKKTLSFVVNMVLGVMISSFIFIPAVSALRSGSRNQMDWSILTNTFRGSMLTLVERYVVGGKSDPVGVSLFCGSFVILGVVSYFALKNISLREKIITFLFGLLVMLTFYWQPAYFAFSLFKQVDSYWCRFSYIGVVFLIYVAAQFYVNFENGFKKYYLIIVAVIYGLVELLLHRHELSWEIFASAIFCLVIAVLLNISGNNLVKYLIGAIVIVELVTSAWGLLKIYSCADNRSFATYNSNAERQVMKLKHYDDSHYRVSQTSNRGSSAEGITANYNEGMAFNYWSISSYMSSQSSTQLDILSSLGYRSEQDRITVVNSPIISSDALLGVKYIFSKYPVNGLTKISSLGKYNGKETYKNDYAFPLAFRADQKIINTQSYWSTFIYQNWLFNNLYGKEINIYQPINYTSEVLQNAIKYNLEIPKGHYAIYGNIMWNNNMEAVLNVNNKAQIGYTKWLSPSVFYIPTNNGDKNASVVLNSNANGVAVSNQEFYALNLDKLSEVSKKIKKQQVAVKFGKNSVTANVKASKTKQYLYLALPKDNGWSIRVNGKKVVSQIYANGLMAIPLNKGRNKLQMTYHVIHQTLGILITVIGILIICFIYVKNRKLI